MNSFVYIVVLAVCCAATGCSPAEPRSVDSQLDACIRVLEFDNLQHRDAFLAVNLPAIVDHFNPPQGALYLFPHPRDANLSVATPGSDCERPDNLRPLVTTREILTIRAELLHSFDVQRDFGDLMGARRLSATAQRACVITARAPSWPDYAPFGLILSELTYGGIPSVQVEQVGERLFVASDENCELTLRYVETVAEELGLDNANPNVCSARSLAECGFS